LGEKGMTNWCRWFWLPSFGQEGELCSGEISSAKGRQLKLKSMMKKYVKWLGEIGRGMNGMKTRRQHLRRGGLGLDLKWFLLEVWSDGFFYLQGFPHIHSNIINDYCIIKLAYHCNISSFWRMPWSLCIQSHFFKVGT
jgi:hypothetical protein